MLPLQRTNEYCKGSISFFIWLRKGHELYSGIVTYNIYLTDRVSS